MATLRTPELVNRETVARAVSAAFREVLGHAPERHTLPLALAMIWVLTDQGQGILQNNVGALVRGEDWSGCLPQTGPVAFMPDFKTYPTLQAGAVDFVLSARRDPGLWTALSTGNALEVAKVIVRSGRGRGGTVEAVAHRLERYRVGWMNWMLEQNYDARGKQALSFGALMFRAVGVGVVLSLASSVIGARRAA